MKTALNSLIQVPFRFEVGGSQIIFYDPEKDYAEAERERELQPVQPFRELTLLEAS